MKFGKYLLEKSLPEWRGHCVDYKSLKDLIKESAQERDEGGLPNYSPRMTSLTVQRAANPMDSAEERFFQSLDAEVDKIGQFTAGLVAALRERLQAVSRQAQMEAAGGSSGDAEASRERRESLLTEAKAVGDEFLKLEKYVNLNYMAFHKILKKHDKLLPDTPCRQFYISHLHNQPWVQGTYSDLLVTLSAVHSQLRGDGGRDRASARAASGAWPPAGHKVSHKYWVHMSDVSAVKHHILQHLPVYQARAEEGNASLTAGGGDLLGSDASLSSEVPSGQLPSSSQPAPLGGTPSSSTDGAAAPAPARPAVPRVRSLRWAVGDAEAINCVYLDNSSLELYHGKLDKRSRAMTLRLRWRGTGLPSRVSVERQVADDQAGEGATSECSFGLPENRVLDFLEGRYGLAEAAREESASRGEGVGGEEAAAGPSTLGEEHPSAPIPPPKHLSVATAAGGRRKKNKARARGGGQGAESKAREGGPKQPPSPLAVVPAAQGAAAEGPAECLALAAREVDAKQLCPMLKTQFMRTDFRIPFDPSVSVHLDTNLTMVRETVSPAFGFAPRGRWTRDPALPLLRSDVTRFPHAVLDITLRLGPGESPPPWVRELVDSGLLTHVPSFSKFLHGVAALYPDMAQALPYWVDDESVKTSLLLAATPEHPSTPLAPGARDLQVRRDGPLAAPRRFLGLDLEALRRRGTAVLGGGSPGEGGAGQPPLATREAAQSARHPLLGNAPTLRLMPPGGGGMSLPKRPARGGLLEASGLQAWMGWWFECPRAAAPLTPARRLPLSAEILAHRPEPKTFFANERTFLSWLHMAVTIGSISSAMLGLSGATRRRRGEGPNEGDTMQLVAVLLLPVAILICAYALLVHGWRSGQIANRTSRYIDDRRGPLVLAGVVVTALGAVFCISLGDLVVYLRGDAAPAPPPEANGWTGGLAGGPLDLRAWEGASRASAI